MVLPGWCISLGRLLNEGLQAWMLWRVHISKKGNLKGPQVGPHGACRVDILCQLTRSQAVVACLPTLSFHPFCDLHLVLLNMLQLPLGPSSSFQLVAHCVGAKATHQQI